MPKLQKHQMFLLKENSNPRYVHEDCDLNDGDDQGDRSSQLLT